MGIQIQTSQNQRYLSKEMGFEKFALDLIFLLKEKSKF